MSVPFDIEVMQGVTVYGDGTIEITTIGSYYGEDVYREFTANDMLLIVIRAQAHEAAYQAYKSRGYEDEEQYHTDFNFISGL